MKTCQTDRNVLQRHSPVAGTFSKYGICVIESHHCSNFSMDWTTGEHYGIFYILGGKGHLVTKETKIPLKEGTVIIVPIQTPYRIVDVPWNPLSLYLLSFSNPEIEAWCEARSIATCRATGHRITCDMVRKQIEEILYEQNIKNPGWDVLMVSLILRLLVNLNRCWFNRAETNTIAPPKESFSHARVESYIRSLSLNFDHQHNLAQAAASTGLRVRRFSTLFQALTGTSWSSYLRQMRIDQAKRLLLETDRSVISICFECGFEDLSTFYRAFQRLENKPPRAYRIAAIKKQGSPDHKFVQHITGLPR